MKLELSIAVIQFFFSSDRNKLGTTGCIIINLSHVVLFIQLDSSPVLNSEQIFKHNDKLKNINFPLSI